MGRSEKTGRFGVAVIGCGGRGRGVTRRLLEAGGGKVRVVSCYDPDREQCKASMSVEQWNSPDTLICRTYKEAISCPGVDWVLVFSPNANHREHIIEGFRQGKHVFSEKPLATEIEDCRKIFDAHRESGRLFATGFVLRYAPIYRKVKELLDSGRFGRIISIDANENIRPPHGQYIMRNWRRYTKNAGPHILEKCCHDLDIINWYCGSRVSRVASFSGRNFFTRKNKYIREKYAREFEEVWPDPHAVKSAFEEDTDLMDNTVAVFEYRNGIRVQFQATMSNAIPERRMFISCETGTIIMELFSGQIQYRIFNEDKTTLDVGLRGGHGGGDQHIMQELYNGPMRKGTLPECGGDEGLESAVLALSIDKASHTGKVVNVEPIWKKLDR